jgi:hypothetical protein
MDLHFFSFFLEETSWFMTILILVTIITSLFSFVVHYFSIEIMPVISNKPFPFFLFNLF